MSSKRKVLGSFTKFPKELVRVQNGDVELRSYEPEKKSFDVKLNKRGKVNGAAEIGSRSEPNGLSMRTAAHSMDLIRNFKGRYPVVYTIPKHAAVPGGLILLLEENNHYTLQPEREISKEELDVKIQQFLNKFTSEPKKDFLTRVEEKPSEVKAGSSSEKKKKSSFKLLSMKGTVETLSDNQQ